MRCVLERTPEILILFSLFFVFKGKNQQLRMSFLFYRKQPSLMLEGLSSVIHSRAQAKHQTEYLLNCRNGMRQPEVVGRKRGVLLQQGRQTATRSEGPEASRILMSLQCPFPRHLILDIRKTLEFLSTRGMRRLLQALTEGRKLVKTEPANGQ